MKFSSTVLSTDALADEPEDRHGEGQGQPDHQRRGGGGRTPRVAQRVLAGQLAHGPEQPGVRRARRPQERPADHRAGRGHAQQHREHPGADPPAVVRHRTRRTARPGPAGRRPPSSARPSSSRRRTDDSGSAMSSRSACTGAIRPVRRAGSQAATIVTDDADGVRRDDRARARRSAAGRPGRGRTSPTSARMPIASSTPSPRPIVEPSTPDHERLELHRAGSPAAWTRRAHAAGPARGCAGRPGSRRC